MEWTKTITLNRTHENIGHERILVTGGTGFIGSHLVEALVKRGHKVRCIVRNDGQTRFLENLGVELVYGGITEKNALQNAVRGMTAVFHLAGILGRWGVPVEVYWDTNVKGTRLLLECCAEQGVTRVIYCGSASALGHIEKPPADEDYPGNPSNVYEQSKAQSEKVVLDYRDKLKVTIIRPEFVYGPGDTHVLRLFKAVKNRKFLIVGNGKSFLHPTYVGDVIQGLILCFENRKSIGQVYNIVGERYLTVEDLISMISRNFGLEMHARHIPSWGANFIASTSELAGRLFGFEPVLTKSRVEFFTVNKAFDSSKARRELGYNPIKLEDGIADTIKWYLEKGYLD